MKIREIAAADVAALFDVRTRTRENAYTLDELHRLGITPESVRDKLATTFKGWLGADGDRVVAFAIADRATGELWVIAVLPEYEGRGIGGELMQHAEDWLWSAGCTRAWLTTDVDARLRAYGFYRHRGWTDWKIEGGLRWMQLDRPQATASATGARESATDEVPVDFGAIASSPRKELVRVFYKEMWDRADIRLVPRIFHEGFTFRGSLGPQLVGHAQFIGYVERVTGALERYTSDILAIAEEGDRVFAKLRFHGWHRKELFGIAPSGRHVWWYGMPVFTFERDKVRDLWVLGDIHGLLGRLRGEPERMP